MKKKVSVLGDGAFGTAFSQLIANNGHEVNLWCYNKQVYEDIKNNKKNSTYLPEVVLNSLITPYINLEESIQDSDIVFEAIPVQFIKSTLSSYSSLLKNKTIVVLSKGIETDTLKLPSQIIEDILNNQSNITVVSGPSFARDLAQRIPTGLVIAAHNDSAYQKVAEILIASKPCDCEKASKNSSHNKVSVYKCSGCKSQIYLEHSKDILGIQLSGAIKNVIALGLGILEGAGYRDNCKALFFYKSISEIKTIIKFYNSDPKSFDTLAGIGDLVLTAFMSQGRNKQLGIKIGQGNLAGNMLKNLSFVPESLNTLKSLKQLIDKNKLDLPLCSALYDIVYNNQSIEILVSNLV